MRKDALKYGRVAINTNLLLLRNKYNKSYRDYKGAKNDTGRINVK